MRPDVELAEDLGVGYGQFDGLADQVYGLAHPADVLVAGGRHVAAARRRAARRCDPRSPTAHAPRQAFDKALPVLLQVSLFASFPRLHDLPARQVSIFPVTPGVVPARVYPLGRRATISAVESRSRMGHLTHGPRSERTRSVMASLSTSKTAHRPSCRRRTTSWP